MTLPTCVAALFGLIIGVAIGTMVGSRLGTKLARWWLSKDQEAIDD